MLLSPKTTRTTTVCADVISSDTTFQDQVGTSKKMFLLPSICGRRNTDRDNHKTSMTPFGTPLPQMRRLSAQVFRPIATKWAPLYGVTSVWTPPPLPGTYSAFTLTKLRTRTTIVCEDEINSDRTFQGQWMFDILTSGT